MKSILTILSVATLGFVLTLSAATTSVPKSAPAPTYVGSSKSTVYHLPSCSSAKKIVPTNLITFATKDEAAKKGYRACKVCKP